jgi:hypothetical protein
MKKFIMTLILILGLCGISIDTSVNAQEWHTASQITVAWDVVDPSLPNDVISYIVRVKNATTGEEQIVGETSELNYTITFTTEGRYYIGVSTKRITGDMTELESEVNWSNENGEATPNPFGVVFYVIPEPPPNLHTP